MCLPTVEPSVHETKKLVCSENIVYGCSMSGSRIVIKIFEKNFLFQTRLDNSIHIHVHTRILYFNQSIFSFNYFFFPSSDRQIEHHSKVIVEDQYQPSVCRRTIECLPSNGMPASVCADNR